MGQGTQKNNVTLLICLCDIRWLKYRRYFKGLNGLYTTKSVINTANTTTDFDRRIKRSLVKQNYITNDIDTFDDLMTYSKTCDGKLLFCSNDTRSEISTSILNKYADDVDLVFLTVNHLTTLERIQGYKFIKDNHVSEKMFKFLFDREWRRPFQQITSL